MGRIEDLGYNPDDVISKPEREGIDYLETPFAQVEEETRKSKEELITGTVPEYADITNPFDSMIVVFERHIENAEYLIEKATFLMDKTIEDTDSYVGDASPIILEYISDLTGLEFANKAKTDPVYTLTPDEMKCIFECAGYYDPRSEGREVVDAANSGDSAAMKEYVRKKIESKSYSETVFYGLKLLIIVLKLSYVIAVHYLVGYFCAIFKDRLRLKWKKSIAGKTIGFDIKLGSMISKIFGTIEKKLLAVVGYRCNQKGKVPSPCDRRAWEKITPNVVTCCTTDPIFFNDTDQGSGRYNMTDCTKSWLLMQLDPSGSAAKRGPVCSGNCSKDRRRTESTIVPRINKYTLDEDESYAVRSENLYSDGIDELYDTSLTDNPELIQGNRKELEALRERFFSQLTAINEKIGAGNSDINLLEQRNIIEREIDDINEALGLSMSKAADDVIFEEVDEFDPTDTSCVVLPEERTKAKAVADFIMTKSSKSGATNPANIPLLSRAISSSDDGATLSKQAISSLDSAKRYSYGGDSASTEGLGDCFGYGVPWGKSQEEREAEMMDALNKRAAELAAERKPTTEDISMDGMFFEMINLLDTTVLKGLNMADKIVVSTGRLSQFAIDKRICCIVYLFVFISGIWGSLVKNKNFCRQTCHKCNGTGVVNGKACDLCNGTGKTDYMTYSEAAREYFRWAPKLKANKDLQAFVNLLGLIKQIVDIFLKRFDRKIHISGIYLPFHDVWELIKTAISNGLSQFLDILFGPLDLALASVTAIPEIRHMVNNECFGFDKVIRFLQCLLNGLKAGIIAEIMTHLDFTLNDYVIINDLFLSRTRLEFLRALSELLGVMIDLLIGLKDCYEPSDLPNQIVDRQLQEQYQSARVVVDLMGSVENVRKLQNASTPIYPETVVVPDYVEVQDIESNSGALSTGFGDEEFTTYVDNMMRDALDHTNINLYDLLLNSTILDSEAEKITPAELLPIGEFIEKMEEMTGVRTSDVKESIVSIRDILLGQI